jgi:O-antigen/teichoic acid export membrane protein
MALRVGKNLAVLIGSHVVNRIAHLILLGIVGRLLGAEVLGGYAVSLAAAAVFLFATDLGLSPWLTREIAARSEGHDGVYARALGVKVAASGVALAGLLLLRLVLPYAPWVIDLSALLILAAVIESVAQMNNAVCRARERMELEATAATIQTTVVVGASVLLLGAGYPPVTLGYAAIAGALAEVAVTFVFVRRFVRVRVRFPKDLSTLHECGHYAVTSLNALAFFQFDVLLLSLVASQAEVGHFAAISRLLQGAGYVVLLAGSALVPTLTVAWSVGGREAFWSIGTRVLRSGFLVAAATAGLLLVSARLVMVGIYGPEFGPLSPLLQLASAYLFLRVLSETLATVLTASGRQSAAAASRLSGTAVMWLLIVLLAPSWATTGAVLALIAGEAIVFSAQAMSLRSRQLAPLAPTTSEVHH